jgi:MbtH protein
MPVPVALEPETWSVVRDQEERYSVWPDDKALPAGWSRQAHGGTRDECLQKIKEVWSDPRPRSLRLAMTDNQARSR